MRMLKPSRLSRLDSRRVAPGRFRRRLWLAYNFYPVVSSENVGMNERASVDAISFESTAELRGWFEKYHDTVDELWIGYFKKASGEPSVTHAEAIDEALCYGWID